MYEVPVYKPYLTRDTLKYAHNAIDSTWISSNGEFLELATESLKKYLRVKHVLLTANGTVANHLMAKVLRTRTTDRNLIVPSNAYVAAWNPFLYDKFFNIIPVDMDEYTWNADYSDVIHRASNVLVVHNLGSVQNVLSLKNKYPHVNFVEDACEALGGGYFSPEKHWQMAGTAGLCSTFSFYGNKNITSGEGGAFVTNDDEAYEYAKHIWGQAQSPDEKFVHTDIGYNYRMTNVQAAILYGQLKDIREIMSLKRRLFLTYDYNFQHCRNVTRLQHSDNGTIHSNWMYGLRFVNNPDYQTAKRFFDSAGIETRPYFYNINTHKHLKGFGEFPVGEMLEREVVVLPSYPELVADNDRLNYVIDKVIEYARRSF